MCRDNLNKKIKNAFMKTGKYVIQSYCVEPHNETLFLF